MISLYCASAFRGSVFASFFASAILDESAGAILMSLNIECSCCFRVVGSSLLLCCRVELQRLALTDNPCK